MKLDFKAANGDEYTIAFSHRRIAFFRMSDAPLPIPRHATRSVEAPYGDHELDDLKTQQTADVIALAHRDHPLMTLIYHGDWIWTLERPDAD